MTTSSKVRFMSSIIASRDPPADRSIPGIGAGVLSSSDSPRDWASRRAGSMVSTTVRRPASAARTPRAAAVVVLPTPPEPQQTMMCVAGSASRASMSRVAADSHSAGLMGAAPVPSPAARSWAASS